MENANDSAVYAIIFTLFPIQFLVIWLMVLGLISLLSGWKKLSSKYRVQDLPDNLDWLGWQTARFNGFMDARSTLWIAMSERGLYLKMGPAFFFRFMHPPLLIPWSDITDVGTKHLFFFKYTAFKVDGVSIWVLGAGLDGADRYCPAFCRLEG